MKAASPRKLSWLPIAGLTTLFMVPVVIYSIGNRMHSSTPLKLPILEFATLEKFDTAVIETIDQYNILENFFSPLFEETDTGEIAGLLAKSAVWQDNSVVIELKDDLKSSTGMPITSEDVAFSLKRILITQRNTHGNLAEIFPNCAALVSPFELCSDIAIVDRLKVRLTPHKESLWLLETLIAQDYAIIPIDAVDRESLKIIDYRNTSGPYWVSEEQRGQGFTVRANENHSHMREFPNAPREAQFVNFPASQTNNLAQAFLEGKITYFPKYYIPSEFKINEIFSQNRKGEGIEVHRTEPNFSRYMQFTNRGLQELSLSERIGMSNFVFSAFQQQFKAAGIQLQTSVTFFPQTADGALNETETESIQALRNSAPAEFFPRVELGTRFGSASVISKAFEAANAPVGLVEYKDINRHVVAETGNIHEPHAYILAHDVSQKETLSSVSPLIYAGLLHETRASGQAWLKKYASESKKELRLKMLQEAHYSALSSGRLVPLYTQGTSSLVSAPWSFKNYPKRRIVDALWLLSLNQ